jgi:hypothetical protein
MTGAGLGLAGSRQPVSQLVTKVVVLGGQFSCGDERQFLVGEVLEPDQRSGRGRCGRRSPARSGRYVPRCRLILEFSR